MLVKTTDVMVNESSVLVNRMETLTESESDYPAVMVPIRYNDRLDQDLVRLESFVEYATQNAIEDAGQALASVCEASNINPSHIGFYVNETTLYADDEMADTVKMFMESGYTVAVAPIPTASTAYQELMEALQLDEECSGYEGSPNLRAYCEDIDLNEGVVDTVKQNVSNAGDFVSGKYHKAKKTVSNVVQSLSDRYASAKQALSRAKDKIRKATGQARVTLSNQISKLESACHVLAKKLASAKKTVAGKASDISSAVKNKAGHVKDTMGNAANTVKNTAGDIAGKAKDTAGNVVDKVKDTAGRVSDKFRFNK